MYDFKGFEISVLPDIQMVWSLVSKSLAFVPFFLLLPQGNLFNPNINDPKTYTSRSDFNLDPVIQTPT